MGILPVLFLHQHKSNELNTLGKFKLHQEFVISREPRRKFGVSVYSAKLLSYRWFLILLEFFLKWCWEIVKVLQCFSLDTGCFFTHCQSSLVPDLFFLFFFSFLFPCLPNHLMLTAESFKHKKVPHSRKKNSIPSASKLAKNQFQNLSLGILLLAACHKTRGKRFYWVINPNLNILIQSAINRYGEGQDRGTTVKPYSNLEKMVEVHGHVMVWGCWGSCHDNLIHHIRSSGKGLIGSSMTMMPNTANEVKAYCGGM